MLDSRGFSFALLFVVAAAGTAEAQSCKREPCSGDRQSDGGLSLAIMGGGGYSFAYMPLDWGGAEGGGVAASSHLGWLGGAFDLQYGFDDHVYLGFTLDVARIVNSDDSTGTATRMSIGPSLLLRPVRPFYVGVDVLLRYTSFDDVDTRFDGYRNDPMLDPEADAEAVLGVALRLRLGFVIEIVDRFAIVPELRFGVQPAAFLLEGADATDYLVGSIRADATNLITASGGLFLGSRLFF